MAKDLEKIFCAKCNKKMELVLIPRYEFEEGVLLHDVKSYKCFNCGGFGENVLEKLL